VRGTVAKGLRKVANRMTPTLPDRRLVWVAPASKKKMAGARPVMLAHRNCTRAFYKILKKRAKKTKQKGGK